MPQASSKSLFGRIEAFSAPATLPAEGPSIFPPPTILTWLFQCKELGLLQALLRQAVTIPSLAEFEDLLREAVAAKNSPAAPLSA